MPLETAGFIVSAVGLSFSVAQTVLGTLQCEQLKDLFGADLDGLEDSVKTILAVLSDAESKQARGIELSAQERNFIDQIKDVVYDADDVIDAYLTRAKLQQIDMESGHNLSTKVRGLYSRFKNLAIASPEVKKIAKKLDKIGKDAQNFKLHFEPNSIIRKETYSTVENDIVGREDDQRRIVDMPLGMASMTSLSRLNRFIVGHRKEEDMLESLRGLRNLRGSLVIDIKRDYKDAKVHSGKGGGYICSTHLHSIGMKWHHERNEEVRVGNDEDVLEALQPHRNLKELTIEHYSSVRIPRWAREDSLTTSLPNLVKITLWNCSGLEELPWLGRLQHLKTLLLAWLKKVEYMENRRSISRDDGGVEEASSKSSTSVESLQLLEMQKLKGWWMGDDEIVNPPAAHILLSFPRLSQLHIFQCPNLTTNLSVEQLYLYGVNERLEGKIRKEIVERVVAGEGSFNIFQN